MIQWKKPSERLPESGVSYLLFSYVKGTEVSCINIGYAVIKDNDITWCADVFTEIQVDYYAEINSPLEKDK